MPTTAPATLDIEPLIARLLDLGQADPDILAKARLEQHVEREADTIVLP